MRFSELTAVRPVAPDEYAVDIDPSAWIIHGPNGGYTAAILLRAMTERIPDRPPRSLTVHYPSSPSPGAATIRTEVVREGRSLVTMTARLEQDGRTIAVALAALSPPWTGPTWTDQLAPVVPPYEVSPALVRRDDLPFTHYWEHRLGFGAPPGGGADHADIGGWTRLVEPEPVDAVVAAALSDCWPPAVFTRADAPYGAPTIDLTIHFRTSLPYSGMEADGPVLCRFVTRTIAEGLLEEDGHVWAPDGTLLVQSRQLAIVLPG